MLRNSLFSFSPLVFFFFSENKHDVFFFCILSKYESSPTRFLIIYLFTLVLLNVLESCSHLLSFTICLVYNWRMFFFSQTKSKTTRNGLTQMILSLYPKRIMITCTRSRERKLVGFFR